MGSKKRVPQYLFVFKTSKMIKKILKKINSRDYTVGIIGLGYVGLPLAWSFYKNGLKIIGFDVDQNKISNLKNGEPYIKHLGSEIISEFANSNSCSFTSDFSKLADVDAIIICVPTPLTKNREPDTSYVRDSSIIISKYLKKGHIVILESTTYPGTTEELMIPVLEKGSSLVAGQDFFIAYSPEREDPGNKNFNTSTIPKVVGGYDKNSLKIAKTLYETSISKVVEVIDTKTAEAVKITENIFRSVNIALVNELKIIYDLMGIDVHEVIDAASTKPFGFMKFTPGPGLGGHCIPIDPFYLSWKARQFDKNTRFIELAGEINTLMPYYVVEKTISALNINQKSLNKSRILIIGIAYKPDIDDMRESPSFKIFDLLKSKGAKIDYHDPYIPKIIDTKDYKDYNGIKSVNITKNTLKNYDAVIISTNHSCIDFNNIANWSNCIIDTRNALSGVIPKNKNHIYKA